VAEKERANAAEYQKALTELERTNAVLTSRRASIEQEAVRARDSAAKDVTAARAEVDAARIDTDEALARGQGAELRVAEQELLTAKLRQELDEASHRLREMDLQHADEARVGEQGEAAQRRVAELERQAAKQRTSHKQRLDELQRYYDKELAKVRAEGEAAGRTAVEAAARGKAVARARELKEVTAAEIARSSKQFQHEIKCLQGQLQQIDQAAAERVAAAERRAQDALAGVCE